LEPSRAFEPDRAFELRRVLEPGQVLVLRSVLKPGRVLKAGCGLGCVLEPGMAGRDGLQAAGHAHRRRDPAVGRCRPRCGEVTGAFHD
jgi:hypothetical protein